MFEQIRRMLPDSNEEEFQMTLTCETWLYGYALVFITVKKIVQYLYKNALWI